MIATKEVFLKDVAKHQMTIPLDMGVYRHVRFQEPRNSNLWFELVTWPGALTIHGDMGTWTFARVEDMFTFFRASRGLTINASYWSEKLQAGPHGGHRMAKVYSDEVFERQLIAQIKSMESEREEELLGAVREEILSQEGEWARLTAAHEFSHSFGRNDSFTFETESVPDGREYGYHFLWCLYAIVWGIQQYDAAKIPMGSVGNSQMWEPIGTAPLDDWFIICLDFYGVTMGRRSQDPEFIWEFFDAEHPEDPQPNGTSCFAHGWMPLPFKPEAVRPAGFRV